MKIKSKKLIMSIILVAIFCFDLCVSASVMIDSQENNTLLIETFDGEDICEWESSTVLVENTITVSQGTKMMKIEGNGQSPMQVVIGDSKWSDYTFSVDFSMQKTGVIGMLFRYCDDLKHYLLQCDSNTVSIYKKNGTASYKQVKRVAFNFELDVVYRTKVELSGTRIKVYINNKALIDVTDSELSSGKVGVSVKKGIAWIDNVAVYVGKEPKELPMKNEKNIMIADTGNLSQCYYVSPNGDDNNTGSINSPFKTINKANDTIRTQGVPDGGVCVYLREGNYYLPEGIEFDSQSGGRNGSIVCYKSYPGEQANITGSIDISRESMIPIPETEKDRISNVNEIKAFDLSSCGVDEIERITPSGFGYSIKCAYYNLYFNDKELTLARWPNNGNTKTGKIIEAGSRPGFGETEQKGFVFEYKDNRPSRWEKTGDIWMRGAWSREWAHNNVQIASIDGKAGTITTVEPSPYGAETEMPYYYYNILEELDMPGEWYIDRENKILYVYPPDEITGNNISLSTVENDLIRFNGSSYMVFENLNIERTRANGVMVGANSENISFQGCKITNVGMNGAQISGKNNGLNGCEIINAGGGGVYIYSPGRTTLEKTWNYCHNSYIENCGYVSYSYLANITGVGNVFTNNVVKNGEVGGISFGGNDNFIAYNEICDVLKTVNDGGAIYAAGRDFTQRGNKIYNNYIHDVYTSEQSNLGGPVGIYLDALSSGNEIIGNTIARVTLPIVVGGGRENVVSGNVIVDKTECSRNSISVDQRGMDTGTYQDQGTIWDRLVNVLKSEYNAMPCTSDVWASKYPKLADIWQDEPQKPKYNVVSENFVYNHKNSSIAEMVSEYGIVEDIIVLTDTNDFQSYENDNFEIKKDSDIHSISNGFKNNEFKRVGLYIDNVIRAQKRQVSDFYPIYPTDNLIRNEDYLRWSTSNGADKYNVQIAEDENFANIVFEDTVSDTSIKIPELEANTNYFWRVKASSNAKSISDNYTISKTCRFRTYSLKELFEFKLNDAKELLNSAVNEVPLKFEIQDLLDFKNQISEIENLNGIQTLFEDDFSNDANKWSTVGTNNCPYYVQNNSLFIGDNTNKQTILLKTEDITKTNQYSIKYKFLLEEGIKSFSGIYFNADIYDEKVSQGYLLQFLNGKLNLYRYPGGDTYNLAGSYDIDTSQGKEYDIEITTNNGFIRVLIDGTLCIEYKDDSPFAAKQVILRNSQQIVSYKDFSVEEIEENNLFISNQIEDIEKAMNDFLEKRILDFTGFADDFESVTVGNQPQDYERVDTNVTVVSDGSGKCLMLNDVDNKTYPAVIKRVDLIKDYVVVRFKFKTDQNSGLMRVKIRENISTAYNDPVVITIGKAIISDNAALKNIEAQKWYSIEVELDLKNNLYNILVDGELLMKDHKFSTTVNHIDSLVFTGDIDPIGKYYIDDIEILGRSNSFRTIYDKNMPENICTEKYFIRTDGTILNLSENSVDGNIYVANYNNRALTDIKVFDNVSIAAKVLYVIDTERISSGSKIMFWTDKLQPLALSKCIQ